MKFSSLEIARMATLAINPELAKGEELPILNLLFKVYGRLITLISATAPDEKHVKFSIDSNSCLIKIFESGDDVEDFFHKFECCYQLLYFTKTYKIIMSEQISEEARAAAQKLKEILEENKHFLKEDKACLVKINSALLMVGSGISDYASISKIMDEVMRTIDYEIFKFQNYATNSKNNQAIANAKKNKNAPITEKVNYHLDEIIKQAAEKKLSISCVAERYFEKNKDALKELGITDSRSLENRISRYKTGRDPNAARKSKTEIQIISLSEDAIFALNGWLNDDKDPNS